MFKDLNDQLVHLKGEIRKKEKWTNQLADYQHDLMKVKESIDHLNKRLSSEQKDVEKLEGLSVTKLLSTILGTTEDRLDKEQKEVVAIQLKLEEATKSKEDIVNSMSQLQNNLDTVGNVETEYQNLLSTKEMYIEESHSPLSFKLLELSDQEAELRTYLLELEEAIRAGNTVDQALTNAINSLEKAEGWGTIDLLGGGMLTDAIKHDHIDDATQFIHKAQSNMRNLQKELLDINEETDMHVDISGLLKFADFFFDGLIADWTVQGKINESLDQTHKQQYELTSLITKLKAKVDQKKQALDKVLDEKKEVVESV